MVLKIRKTKQETDGRSESSMCHPGEGTGNCSEYLEKKGVTFGQLPNMQTYLSKGLDMEKWPWQPHSMWKSTGM